MYFKSKKISLIILAITSLIFSRVMFVFFNDPEGPNLLVTTGMAVIVYLLSLPIYLFGLKAIGSRRLLFGILIQIIIVSVIYFLLK